MNGHLRPKETLNFKKMMTKRLEDLASKDDQFLKAQRNLVYLSSQVVETEERKKFLSRCLSSNSIPSPDQFYRLKLHWTDANDKESLRQAIYNLEELLKSKKDNYEKALECMLKHIDHCFQEILLRFVNQKTAFKRKFVKQRYINEFQKIQAKENKKNKQRLSECKGDAPMYKDLPSSYSIASSDNYPRITTKIFRSSSLRWKRRSRIHFREDGARHRDHIKPKKFQTVKTTFFQNKKNFYAAVPNISEKENAVDLNLVHEKLERLQL